MGRGFRSFLRAMLFVAAIVGIVAGVLKAFFVDVVTIGHNGMAPTLLLGDQVLVWRGARLDRNDIVVCRHPSEPGRYVIGRVALVPGMSIGLVRGQLLIDGRRLDRDIRGQVRFSDRETGRIWSMTWGVEEFADRHEHLFFERTDRAMVLREVRNAQGYYLLGDNRGHVGEDSRAFGLVQASDCIGQVFMRLEPAPGMPEGIPHGWFDLL